MGFFDKPKTFTDKRGYNRFSDSGKSVSRWVAEKKIDRALKPQEVVHHINRNKTDNRPENLHVFSSQRAHDNAHKIDERRFGKNVSYKGFRK